MIWFLVSWKTSQVFSKALRQCPVTLSPRHLVDNRFDRKNFNRWCCGHSYYSPLCFYSAAAGRALLSFSTSLLPSVLRWDSDTAPAGKAVAALSSYFSPAADSLRGRARFVALLLQCLPDGQKPDIPLQNNNVTAKNKVKDCKETWQDTNPNPGLTPGNGPRREFIQSYSYS